jgi:uncharacterized membrane protein (UPF0127 family)
MRQIEAVYSRLGVALLALGCSRTPPEPAPTSATDSPAVTSQKASPMTVPAAPAATASSRRCIATTPAEAPPIPEVASLAACPKDPDGSPKAETGLVTFPEAPGTPKVDVELALIERDITRGLMYRRSMPEDHGMLFRLDERKEHMFWMHNTCMPLDMLFVDEDDTIVGIVEAATPLTDSSRTVGCPSRYVLEVNAGWSRRHGVRAGQKLSIPANAR